MTGNGGILSHQKTAGWRIIQRNLAKKVIREDSFNMPPRLVAGVDVAYTKDKAYAAAVVLDYETLELVEERASKSTVKIPYIPSFLAFRELKPLIRVIKKLREKPEIFLVNAHGIAHPEKCGCASHLGVTLDIPTIGIAKQALYGDIVDSENQDIKYLKDGEVIGAALVTEISRKPIYISIGHRISLESAIGIVRKTTRIQMPEPLRLAHELSNETKRKSSI
jgi:deoxyribonuclease V